MDEISEGPSLIGENCAKSKLSSNDDDVDMDVDIVEDDDGDDDQISSFPDEILIAIVSCLSVKEAARTSILSSRWRNLWKLITRIDLESESVLNRMASNEDIHFSEKLKYVKLVNKVLCSCKSPTLSEFRLCFDLSHTWRFSIDMWVKYAFAKQVQRLELDFPECGDKNRLLSGEHYVFPEMLIAYSGGESLSDKTTSFFCEYFDIPARPISFESLKVLSLKSVNISEESIQFFLSRCPFLERLVVWGSSKLLNLKVSGSSLKLKHLEINDCGNLECLEVSNTNLTSLCFARSSGIRGMLLLENLPMLVDVSVTSTSTDFFNNVFNMLLCCLSQLETLTLCGGKPKEMVKVHAFPEFSKLKKLVLRFWADRNKNFLALTTFIKAAPLLQEFVLELAWFDPSKSEKLVEKVVGVPHEFLKVVKISGYSGRTSELELVRYFLENAAALKKIIVDPCKVYKKRKSPTDKDIASEQNRRSFIKQQLEEEVPGHIELVVL